MKTQVDLVNHALALLMVVQVGQPVATEDYNAVAVFLDPVVAELDADGTTTIDLEAIDDRVFLPLARYLANEAAPAFGLPYSVEAKVTARRDIIRATALPATSSPLSALYF